MQFNDIKVENQRRSYLNQCKFVHFYRLEPIEKGHYSILLHANFNTKGNYSETQNDIICKLLYTLGDVVVLVSGASFDGDKSSVKTFCKQFYEGITAELNSERTPDLIKYCKDYKGPVPCPDPLHLLNRVRTNVLLNYSRIYHSGANVLHSNIINDSTIRKATDLTNSKIFR